MTTSMWSSSKTISSGIDSGIISIDGAATGSVNSICSPPVNLWLALTTLPLTSARPSLNARRIFERVAGISSESPR
ncbi:MAG: hypothetical protein IH914_07185 [candidate division Zixibacteria bacterium]|nr:hypothetical protein [candidate division Zixibacteria bacterium]